MSESVSLAFFFSLYYQRDDQHVDAHAQKVVGYLYKGTGGYGGVYVYLLENKRQQGSPQGSYQHQRKQAYGNSVSHNLCEPELVNVIA